MTSLRQLAKQLGVSQPFLSQIRAGKRPMPENLREKVDALGAYHLLIDGEGKNGDNESVKAVSSVVGVDIAEVSGSSPLPPTIVDNSQNSRLRFNLFWR